MGLGPKLVILPQNERFIVLGVILLIWLIVRGSQLIGSRRSASLPPGTPRDYGLSGGAICPKCQRPALLGLMPMKFGLGTKIIRCPYCGKWSIVRRASLEELRAAEAAELANVQLVHEKSEEEKMKELIEESRFTKK